MQFLRAGNIKVVQLPENFTFSNTTNLVGNGNSGNKTQPFVPRDDLREFVIEEIVDENTDPISASQLWDLGVPAGSSHIGFKNPENRSPLKSLSTPIINVRDNDESSLTTVSSSILTQEKSKTGKNLPVTYNFAMKILSMTKFS